jgi:hypothetical protein
MSHNVALVSQEVFDSCTNFPALNSKEIISSPTPEPKPADNIVRFNYTLNRGVGSTYYFVCTLEGHCAAGLKVRLST